MENNGSGIKRHFFCIVGSVMVDTKFCKKCSTEKALDQFYLIKGKHESPCKECRKTWRKNWITPELHNTYNRNWKRKNPEKVQMYNEKHYKKIRKYYIKNRWKYVKEQKESLTIEEIKLKRTEYHRAYSCFRRKGDTLPLKEWREKWGAKSGDERLSSPAADERSRDDG